MKRAFYRGVQERIFLEIPNLEGHPNCITDSEVTTVLLNGLILPIGGASAVEGLRSTGLPRLVLMFHLGSK